MSMRPRSFCASRTHSPRLALRYTTKLQRLVVTQEMKNLKTLDLDGSAIDTLEGLEHLTGLERLHLRFTTRLRRLVVRNEMKHLETLNLEGSGIGTLEGL